MSIIPEIQQIAMKLTLPNLGRGRIDLSAEKEENLEFLFRILKAEQEKREQSKEAKRKQESRLPKKEYRTDGLNSGLAWQIEQLEKMDWVNDSQNLFLIGNCGTGKTSLASLLGNKAIENGFKVSYTSIDSFIWIVSNKEEERKLNGRYQYWLSSDLIIIDDFLYTRLTDEELIVLYKATMLFNETRSLMIISNRSISEWKDDHNDTHLVNTLIDRLTANSQTIHLK